MKETLKLALLAAALTAIIIGIETLLYPGLAENGTVYVLCNPDNYVNIRETPSKKGCLGGRAYCGDGFETDGIVRNGFVHVYCATEMGEGWISKGFIAWCKPEEVNETWIVDSNGRVAARSTIGGKRNKWLKNGKEVTVYYVAEVAVTNYGFVDAEYLSPVSAEE